MNALPTDLLKSVALVLADYLTARLPKVGGDWWTTRVISCMSPHQHRAIQKVTPGSLRMLDLAALLRVADGNWRTLSDMEVLTSQDRNYLKEMVAVRNRWAHETATPVTDEDVYRDLDTIERFLRVISNSSEMVQEIQKAKKSLLARMASHNTDRPLRPQDVRKAVANPASIPVDKAVALVEVLDPGSATPTRTWTGNDVTARNHHGPVNIDESPLTIGLKWRKSPQHAAISIGVFKLDLSGLLKAGYVRKEKTPGMVRLRFWHGPDNLIYIQVNSESRKLPVGRADF